MKKIFLIIFALMLANCSTDSMVDKLKNLDKAKCYDKESKTLKIGCKK